MSRLKEKQFRLTPSHIVRWLIFSLLVIFAFIYLNQAINLTRSNQDSNILGVTSESNDWLIDYLDQKIATDLNLKPKFDNLVVDFKKYLFNQVKNLERKALDRLYHKANTVIDKQ